MTLRAAFLVRQPSEFMTSVFFRKGACRYALLIVLSLALPAAGAATKAQTLTARLSITSVAPARLHIEGDCAVATKAWSFLNDYAGAARLAERVENLALADAAGVEAAVRSLAPGEYEAARAVTHFRYDLRVDPPAFLTDAAHISWLNTERGILLPADILPLHTGSAKLSFVVPAGWTVASSETKYRDHEFELADAAHTVFFIGRDLRERRGRVGAMDFSFVTAGAWAFSDEDFSRIVGDTLGEYVKMIGGAPHRRALIILSAFPHPAAGSNWSSETRGATVLLLSGIAPSKTAALAQLSNTLAHELLHLWIPNGLALEGEYDWFYEGFTLYLAMRTGMRQGQLSFQDYLNALGRAFDGYRSARGTVELSLIEASRRRWSGAAAFVYNKGMLVAFLYDLTLMQQTSGKRTIGDVYRELFQRYGGKEAREDGNLAVTRILSSIGGMEGFTARYVEQPLSIDLNSAVAPFGLQTELIGGRTRVTVNESLNHSQRDLLGKLGYNERADAATRQLHEMLRKSRQRWSPN